jgi:hypothetical protein
MNLSSRLATLERRHQEEAIGFAVTRQSPTDEVFQTIVHAAGHRYESIEAFFAARPTGQIAGGLIMTDDGTEPAHGSLMAQWFSPEPYP